MNGAFYAILALGPAALGPLPEEAKVLQAKLCGGETIQLDIPMQQPQAPAPCHAKGCHSGSCRKRFDPAQ
ncbi:MAG: hypothetical protein H6920_06345 [Sphingomonadaceae bacterium]|nr:hypothetical protein [Sphingomonadaceae bacterium]MCP5383343.1 hypothetical protein [Altererythrobacter sp.]MCP5391221.1 hypothetical protein [Sphingomonadaceae bacterium]MCP5393520.1 hypothetical protein [Sphingomonadaceae bacterium]